MPPLSEAQREHFERRLLDERARIVRTLESAVGDSEAGDVTERAGDLSSMPSHPADIGTDMMDAELAASNAARMSRGLADIDAALERLYRTPERFGVCEDTGGAIPLARLEIIPWARTCAQAGA